MCDLLHTVAVGGRALSSAAGLTTIEREDIAGG
jgi:hypothetical protein